MTSSKSSFWTHKLRFCFSLTTYKLITLILGCWNNVSGIRRCVYLHVTVEAICILSCFDIAMKTYHNHLWICFTFSVSFPPSPMLKSYVVFRLFHTSLFSLFSRACVLFCLCSSAFVAVTEMRAVGPQSLCLMNLHFSSLFSSLEGGLKQ